jgi:hypothetical protein
MKKTVILLLGLIVMAPGCQTKTELTDADKNAIVSAVKEISEPFWGWNGTMDQTNITEFLAIYDENSDNAWQPEPVSVIFNTQIIKTHAEWIEMCKEMLESRSAMNMSIVDSHFNVLSADKVLEVNKVDYTITTRDSIVDGPFTAVNTILWVKVDGNWKMQFFHESTALKEQ